MSNKECRMMTRTKSSRRQDAPFDIQHSAFNIRYLPTWPTDPSGHPPDEHRMSNPPKAEMSNDDPLEDARR